MYSINCLPLWTGKQEFSELVKSPFLNSFRPNKSLISVSVFVCSLTPQKTACPNKGLNLKDDSPWYAGGFRLKKHPDSANRY